MERSLTDSINELKTLILCGEREPILQHLERLYHVYGSDALLFVISAAIDAGWIEEAWLLVAAVITIEPVKSSILASWIAQHLRERGWGFLADAVEQAGEQSFTNHFGVSRSELTCSWNVSNPDENEAT